MAKRGYKVEIWDKRADPATKPVYAGRSVNLALTKRAIKAFDEIG